MLSIILKLLMRSDRGDIELSKAATVFLTVKRICLIRCIEKLSLPIFYLPRVCG